MQTASEITLTQEIIVICPHCQAQNFFDSNTSPSLFPNGGVVSCDMIDCDQKFKVPAIKQAVK